MSTESASFAVANSMRPIEGFQTDCRIRGLAPGSIPRYISIIEIFCKFLESRQIDILDVDRDVLRSFLEFLRLEACCQELSKNSKFHSDQYL